MSSWSGKIPAFSFPLTALDAGRRRAPVFSRSGPPPHWEPRPCAACLSHGWNWPALRPTPSVSWASFKTQPVLRGVPSPPRKNSQFSCSNFADNFRHLAHNVFMALNHDSTEPVSFCLSGRRRDICRTPTPLKIFSFSTDFLQVFLFPGKYADPYDPISHIAVHPYQTCLASAQSPHPKSSAQRLASQTPLTPPAPLFHRGRAEICCNQH